jgi:type VI protein secretion system component VasK
MFLSLFAYSALVALLVMSNWDHVILVLAWSYSLASRWVTISAILVVYGLVLVYLLLVVHSLSVPQENHRKRHKNTLVPYYDENGEFCPC